MNAVPKRLFSALVLTLFFGFTGTLAAGAQTVSACSRLGGSDGAFSQLTCRINAGATLTAPNTLYVVATTPAGTTTSSCTARPSAGYTVQGNAATVPATAATTGVTGVGLTGCELQVQFGSVPGGTALGDVGLTLPSSVSAGTAIQLSALVCSDPTCAGLISSQTLSATVSGQGNRDRNRDHDRDNDDQCANGYASYGYCQQNQQYCNGVYVPVGQYCGPGGVQYCNGVPVPPGGTCNPYCPTGQIAVIGQPCVSGVTTVTYPAGWNIVGGPAGTVLTGVVSPLYSFPPSATAYVVQPSTTPLQAGTGYWAYFNVPTTVTLPSYGSGNVTIQLPPNQFTMIGNPTNTTATVSGPALTILVYNPSSASYTPATQLQPGQGAWVASPIGGPITISGGYPPLQPPPPL